MSRGYLFITFNSVSLIMDGADIRNFNARQSTTPKTLLCRERRPRSDPGLLDDLSCAPRVLS